MSEVNAKPVIFLAFAQDRVEGGEYLRNLPVELDGVRKALQKARRAGLCEVVERSNTTVESILDVFQEYQDRIAVLHYGGHADSYELLLESLSGEHATAHSEGLVSFLAKQKGLQLVFLNGCCSQQQAQDLIEAGVPAVVGTSQKIDDGVATNLSIRFYKGLGEGLTIDRAWNEAVDQVRIEKGTSNHRGLHWKGKTEVSDRFPWEIYYRKGAEIVKDWNLPEAVENPLFGLPPIPKTHDLPETPFLFLKRYEREHAEIFFGRSYYVRELYNRISDRNAPPIILLYGQSGAGKSSLFDAGLRPRLEDDFEVVYVRRMQEKGLAGSLTFALEQKLEKKDDKPPPEQRANENDKRDPGDLQTIEQLAAAASEAPAEIREEIETLIERLRKTQRSEEPKFKTTDLSQNDNLETLWKRVELQVRKPLIVILDQAEEVFTRPNALAPNELDDFLAALESVFGTPEQRPLGKLLLGYRKEYHPEMEEGFRARRLPRTSVFLEQLRRKDILDIFRGLTQTHELKVRYNLSTDENLPVMIADDLIEDKDSPVAPVLQILLTKLWSLATKKNHAAPHFEIDQYLKLKKEGVAMGEFFNQQMQQLRAWRSDAVDSGLALDVLHFHTTKLGTAGSRDLEEIRKNYRHRQEIIDDLIGKCKELYLLTDGQKSDDSASLTHDSLAPIVAMQYSNSDKPGQRAARVLENKINDFNKEENEVWLDEADLEIVEQGKEGMRRLVVDEEKLLEISRARKAQLEQERQRNRRIRLGLVALIAVFSVFAVWQWREASAQREIASREAAEAQSNLLALQADEVFRTDGTQAIRVAEAAYGLAATTAAEKTLLKIYYNSLAETRLFYQNEFLHDDEIVSIVFSPNGGKLLTASRDETAKLWSTDGNLTANLRHESAVNAAVFSPDGSLIATASDDATVKLWSGNGDSINVLQHAAGVRSATFAPNGSSLLTAQDNGAALLWSNVNSSPASLTLTHHVFLPLNAAVFSPDGERILTAGVDGYVRLWSISGDSLGLFRHDAAANSAAFSNDGNFVLTASNDSTARLWNASGELQRILQHNGPVYAAIFQLDGSGVLTISEDSTAALWSIDGEKLAVFEHGSAAVSAKFSENKSLLATASRDSAARLWAFDGALAATLAHGDGLLEVVFSADGSQIATASKDGSARVWQTNIDVIPTFEHDAGVKSLAISPNNGQIFTGSDDGAVRIYAADGGLITARKHSAGVTDVIFSPTGDRALTASRDKTAKLWSSEGKLLTTFHHDSTVYDVSFSKNGREILTASLDGAAKRWSENGGSLASFEHDGPVYSARFSPDGQYVLTASDDLTARLWKTNGDSVLTLWHEGEVWSAVFSPGGKMVLTASSDYAAHLWTLDGDSLTIFPHDDRVWRAAFSPDGKSVLTASFDATARLWALSGELLSTYSHDGWVWSATFSKDGRHVLTASDDANARLWSVEGDTLMTFNHETGVQSAVFSPDGLSVFTGSDDAAVRKWKTAAGIREWLRKAPVYKKAEPVSLSSDF